MKDEDFEVNVTSRSGPVPSAFMYNYYLSGYKTQDDDATLIDMAIVNMKDIELQKAFNRMINTGVFSVVKKVTIVKVHPENLDELTQDCFSDMMKALEKEGFFKDGLYVAVEL